MEFLMIMWPESHLTIGKNLYFNDALALRDRDFGDRKFDAGSTLYLGFICL